jgi:ABC-2 type transport system ATP-binding protein
MMLAHLKNTQLGGTVPHSARAGRPDGADRHAGAERPPAIEIRGLTKQYGPVRAVDDLTFAIATGAVVGFLGPNGAGKTTTLRMLLGLVAPTAGEATILGVPYRDIADRSRRVGVVLDASAIHPGRTARGHLRVRAAGARIDPARIDEVLAEVELTDAADRRVGQFSLGMRQRLALAAALLGDPQVLILDEPANGLDPEGVRWLRRFLRDRARNGNTVLVSSHVLGEVAQTVSEVVIINRGRLVTQSPLDQLLARAPQRVAVRTPRAEDLRAALADQHIDAELVDHDRLHVTGSTPERVASLAAQAAISLYESTAEPPTLEDIFMTMVDRQTGEAHR